MYGKGRVYYITMYLYVLGESFNFKDFFLATLHNKEFK